ncbi:hypothetical protein G9P44_001857 [Scheffersomyces stipitis]|nr:hypothetical protein G9P44_001857 [Scheffersomyces stipitis]
MFSKQALRVTIPVLASSGIIISSSPVKNEPKRRFYEDETDVVPVPGTVTPAAGTELEARIEPLDRRYFPTFPVAFGLAAFKYFLPQTFANTTGFLWKLEKNNLPQIAQQQEYVFNKTGELVQKIEQTSESSKKSIESSIHSLKHSIADVTGLNINEEVSKK